MRLPDVPEHRYLGLYGFSLSFGGYANTTPPKWIGDTSYLFMRGVAPEWQDPQPVLKDGKPVMKDGKPVMTEGQAVMYKSPGTNVPVATYMFFQCMFFIITPALICGAFAERMKFSTMVVFMILWGTLIYCPLAHWVWGGGIFCYGSDNAGGIFQGGALDFAGGTVVHISSGVSALICALLIGKRLGFRQDGHATAQSHLHGHRRRDALGRLVRLQRRKRGQRGRIGHERLHGHALLRGSAGLTWAALEWFFRGKPSVLGACSGVVAGLVCITPASGFVTPMPALIMGVAVSCVCYAACTVVKSRFGYDDSLDAFGVHGMGGTLGALLTGVFATRAAGGITVRGHIGDKLGLIENGGVMKAQILAVITTWVLAAVGTFVILKILDAVMGLRVSREAEMEGLDVSQHNEEGYIFIE